MIKIKKMAENIFKGKVRGKIVEVRFAISGKLTILNKREGDSVKKGELLAALDKKILQTQLDKELADYEKVRAEFEIYNLQKGEPTNDLAKYLKSQKQAELNASVKTVELAKFQLELTDLFSPVEGVVIEDSNSVAGIYITPASASFKILDTSSFYFEMEISQTDLLLFKTPQQLTIRITGLEKGIVGQTRPIISNENGKIIVKAELQDKTDLVLGLEGEVGMSSP